MSITAIKIVPRIAISKLDDKLPYMWDLISIATPKDPLLNAETVEKLTSLGMRHSLALEFDDITDIEANKINDRYSRSIVLFNEEHAAFIFNFVNKIHCDKSCEKTTLIVHCDAGVSRSGAVGECINDYLSLDYNKFFKNNKNIMPNPYVKRLLKNYIESKNHLPTVE